MPKPTVLARMIVLVSVLAIAEGKAPSDWGSVQTIAPGTQVRVVTAGNAKAVSGTLVSVTDTTFLVLSVGAGQQPFEKAQVAGISVKKPGHRLRNTLIGLGVGLAVGGVEALAIGSCKDCNPGQSTTGYAIGGGAIWGVLVGALWPTGLWHKVYER